MSTSQGLTGEGAVDSLGRTPRLQVGVLGLVQLREGSAVVPLTPSERTLLAGIAMARGRVVTVSALSDWVWGGGHHASPRNRIQALVSAIRRKVAPLPVIVTHEVGYLLDAGVATDLLSRDEIRGRLAELGGDADQRRALLHEAAALATTEPLDGCHATPEVDSVRRRLEEEHLELLAERIDADLATDHLDGLVAELSGLTERHPFNETFLAQLMRVLARNGRQAEALAVYRKAYRRLDDELGVRPGAQLRAAHQEVLRAVDDSAADEHDASSVGRLGAAGRGDDLVGRASLDGPDSVDAIEGKEPAPGGGTDSTAADRRTDRAAPSSTPSSSSGTSPSTSPSTSPRTAPRTVTRLVGRQQELGAVLDATQEEEGPAPVVAITGLGGMGKSALAIEAAHLLRDRFPDGTLYLDLNTETGRAGTSSILAFFLGLLGVQAEAVPATHDARVALFRSVIDERRVLIVLDDVPPDLEVTALLPIRSTSMAIVTSRRPVVGMHPTSHVRLAGLPDADGAELLRGLIGADRPATPEAELAALAHECRGLPLLLRITAQRIAARPDLTVRRATQTLATTIEGRPEDGDRALFAGLGLAEAPLRDVSRSALAGLARLPVSRFSRWVVAAIAGGAVAGDEAVDELHAACFLEPVLRPDASTQFQLHDLVRLYAQTAIAPTQGPTADPMSAVCRDLLALARLHARAFPARLLPPPPAHPSEPSEPGQPEPLTPEDALEFFRTEQDTTLACVRWATVHQPALAWRLLALMANHTQMGVEPGLWIAAASGVRSSLGDPRDDVHDAETADARRGHAYLSLAESLIRHEASDAKHGAPHAVRARRALVLDGDLPGALSAAVVLGRSQRANGRRAAAEESLSWASSSCSDDTTPELRGYVELAWGSLLDDYDELRPARARLTAALQHLDPTDDWSGRATAQFALARVHRRLGEYESGLPLCDSAMALFERLGDVNGRTAVLDTRADLLVHMGDPIGALGAAREAVEQAGQRRDVFMFHRAQRTLGRALAGLGRLDDAEQTLRLSVDGFDAMARPLSLAASLRDLGRVLQLVGRVDEARDVFVRERRCLERAGLGDLSEVDELISRLDDRKAGRRRRPRNIG